MLLMQMVNRSNIINVCIKVSCVNKKLLCSFCINILFYHLGLGFGLATVLHMLSISHYFQKYKASALGLGYSGDCCGSFVFPLIFEYLISNYDVKDTFLILGGIVLNVVPMGLLLREPSWNKSGKDKRECNKNYNELVKSKNLNCKQKHKNKCKIKSDDLLPTSAVNDRIKNEYGQHCNLAFENISTTKKTLRVERHFIGEYNEAFHSSEDNLNSSKEGMENLDTKKLYSNQESHPSVTSHSHSTNLISSINKAVESSDINSSNTEPNDFKLPHTDGNSSAILKIIKSDSDLNEMNESPSPLNGLDQFNSGENFLSASENNSTTSIYEREADLDKEVITPSGNSPKKHERITHTERQNADYSEELENLKTSNFITQPSHGTENKLFETNQVTHDALIIQISTLNPKSECQLKIADPNLDFDSKNCTHQSSKHANNRNELKDNFWEISDNPGSTSEDKSSTSSILKIMIHTNLNLMFILISLSRAMNAVLITSVLTIIIDYTIDLNTSRDQGKYLIIAFSAADLAGRLSFGVVLDTKILKMKDYAGCTTLLMGTIVAVIPLVENFSYIMACMCIYGLIQGGNSIMYPILISMYMDRDSESVAMGCLNFYAGFLLFFMAPIIG